MKRMVTYLYEYRNGTKGAGAGFLKLDTRGNDCRVQLCLQGKNAGEEQGMVYFVVKQNEPVGILLGEVTARQGTIGGSWVVNRDSICGSPWSFSDVEGMAVQYPSGRYLASCWMEEPDEGFLRGTFSMWNRNPQEISDTEKRMQDPDESELQDPDESEMQDPDEPELQDYKEQPGIQLEEQQQEQWEKEQQQERRSSSYKVDRIDISDIRSFPKKNWHLCSNSFVIHGFFNYHYLVCIHKEEDGRFRQYLGVPGVYAKPERAMAMLFGFPEFEQLKQQEEPKRVLQHTEELQEGTFGYWCCQLEL